MGDQHLQNVSKLRITVIYENTAPDVKFACLLETAVKYVRKGIHWYKSSKDGELLKVRNECVPGTVIQAYRKFKNQQKMSIL